MKFTDEGIILSFSTCGEEGCIVTLFSCKHGKVRGFIKSPKGLSKGDICYFEWQSRLQEQLGKLKLEVLKSTFKTTFGNNYGNLALQSICELLSNSICEKDSHEALYKATKECLENIRDKRAYAIWEVSFLKYIGYGLETDECCVTHETKDLFYISPKTGKSVTKAIGKPYAKKLFVIPEFWKCNWEDRKKIGIDPDIIDSLDITGYFINKVANDFGFRFPNLYRNLLIKSL